MKIYSYKNYQEYVESQIEANHAKINNVYVRKDTIDNIISKCPNATSVLCHGTRNGAEQRMFLKGLPNARVLGTEISDTAENFENTVRWDFQNPNPDWISAWDIVYSNSFDHSFDPDKTLDTWREQLSDNGVLFIEHSPHVKSRRWDPLEISSQELVELFPKHNLTMVEQWDILDNHPRIMYQLKRTTS